MTLSKQIVTSGTQVSNGTEELALSVSVDHHSLGSTTHEQFCVIVPRPSTPWCDPMYKQRSSSDAMASLQTAAFLANQDRLAVTYRHSVLTRSLRDSYPEQFQCAL